MKRGSGVVRCLFFIDQVLPLPLSSSSGVETQAVAVINEERGGGGGVEGQSEAHRSSGQCYSRHHLRHTVVPTRAEWS